MLGVRELVLDLRIRRNIKIIHEMVLYGSWFVVFEKKTEQVFYNIVYVSGGYLLQAAHCPEIDQGSGTHSLNNKSDLGFGFKALQGGILN